MNVQPMKNGEIKGYKEMKKKNKDQCAAWNWSATCQRGLRTLLGHECSILHYSISKMKSLKLHQTYKDCLPLSIQQ